MVRSAPLASLRPLALLEFGLPAAPPRVVERGPLPSGGDAFLVTTPAGTCLILISGDQPLQLAFEATLFDLLAEERFPAPRPRRASSGALIARLQEAPGRVAAACYAKPPGERLAAADATTQQLLELGRLLARLHQLGEAHPAAVADPADGPSLASRLPAGATADRLGPILRSPPAGLPTGACHGGLGPDHALFLGQRCSAVLPSGRASSSPLLLDLAAALVAWALPLDQPAPALRALISGYQALRRLVSEERDLLWHSLRHAAAREGACRALVGDTDRALEPLEAVEKLGPHEVRAAAG